MLGTNNRNYRDLFRKFKLDQKNICGLSMIVLITSIRCKSSMGYFWVKNCLSYLLCLLFGFWANLLLSTSFVQHMLINFLPRLLINTYFAYSQIICIQFEDFDHFSVWLTSDTDAMSFTSWCRMTMVKLFDLCIEIFTYHYFYFSRVRLIYPGVWK